MGMSRGLWDNSLKNITISKSHFLNLPQEQGNQRGLNTDFPLTKSKRILRLGKCISFKSEAGVVELVDARDSKSRGLYAHGGSIPPSGTNNFPSTLKK